MVIRPVMEPAPMVYWFWASVAGWMGLEMGVWLREMGGTKGQNRDRGSRVAAYEWPWRAAARWNSGR